jgi:hypothetical protein
MSRPWRIGVAVVAAALGVRAPAAAQAAAEAGDGPRALELAYRLNSTAAWGLRSAGGASWSVLADIPRTRGVGVRLSYASRARLAAFLACDLTLYGDLSGFSTVVIGGAYRMPLARGVALAASAGLGHVVHSSDMAFWNLVWGGELRASLTPRLTLGAGVETFEPLGDARGRESGRSTVTKAPSRLVLALGWSFGQRVR